MSGFLVEQFYLTVFVVLEIKPRTLSILSKHCTTEPYPYTKLVFTSVYFILYDNILSQIELEWHVQMMVRK